ncbi:hypothetical protein [Pelagicoccus sp. SDUM812002]|uniref:magnesium transporter MgtE N-terminal domain-containing protein n=1 Tax=Pelagicoccus sp. SDUM812002 TaxID=3041266 RepID=UPI00280CE86E|nr:hypothetical protein [Pelagicoccus sp. SDUM812002]MDQ8184370.1 hypothetical protein [Pelagicoccus sp. SDUM812002]
MNKRKTTLALAYLKDHPKSASRSLEQNTASEIAQFLADTPVPYTIPILTHMLPHVVARACKLMPSESLTSIISPLEAVSIAAIFRYLPVQIRQDLQAQLPARKRHATTTLLGFNQNAVGSWMVPDAPALPSDGNGNQARSIIETMEEHQKTDYFFVIDRDRRLVGRIHFTDTLSLSPEQKISSCLKTDCRALNGRVSLTQAAEHSHWDHYDVLPVVGPNNHYNGILRHVDLRRGLRHLSKMAGSHGSQAQANSNLSDYGHSLAAALLGMFHMLDSDTRSS